MKANWWFSHVFNILCPWLYKFLASISRESSKAIQDDGILQPFEYFDARPQNLTSHVQKKSLIHFCRFSVFQDCAFSPQIPPCDDVRNDFAQQTSNSIFQIPNFLFLSKWIASEDENPFSDIERERRRKTAISLPPAIVREFLSDLCKHFAIKLFLLFFKQYGGL